MHIKLLRSRFGLSLLGIVASAAVPVTATETSQVLAIEACTASGAVAPADAVAAVADGRGGSLVWLTDAEANLWLCNADAQGQVYALSMIFDDLLAGAGAALVTPIFLDRDGKPRPPVAEPFAVAQSACQAYLGDEARPAVVSGQDGLGTNWLPGYFFFFETEAGETFLCDATANAQVWAFARIGEPLAFGVPVG